MRRRIQTLQVILNASVISGEPEAPAVLDEFNEVARVNQLIPITRRNLIQMLTSTRGLDTALRVFLRVRHIPMPAPPSLGTYLDRLHNHTVAGVGRFTDAERRNYKRRIANIRNRYMHTAGVHPTTNEVQQILGDMHACLVRALSL